MKSRELLYKSVPPGYLHKLRAEQTSWNGKRQRGSLNTIWFAGYPSVFKVFKRRRCMPSESFDCSGIKVSHEFVCLIYFWRVETWDFLATENSKFYVTLQSYVLFRMINHAGQKLITLMYKNRTKEKSLQEMRRQHFVSYFKFLVVD